jgi:hypothetical protein
MREQGIAANATRRAIRGRNKRSNIDKMLRAEEYGQPRVLRERVESVVKDYHAGGGFHEPAREKLTETRKAIVGQWTTAADILDKQGETTLAREVRNFASRLPTVLTDREKFAVDYVLHRQRAATSRTPADPNSQRRHRDDLTR